MVRQRSRVSVYHGARINERKSAASTRNMVMEGKFLHVSQDGSAWLARRRGSQEKNGLQHSSVKVSRGQAALASAKRLYSSSTTTQLQGGSAQPPQFGVSANPPA